MTGNIIVFPEALKNAAAEIGKRSAEWNEEAEKIVSEQHKNAMSICGKIIGEYAELLEKISAEYENAAKKTGLITEGKYEQK